MPSCTPRCGPATNAVVVVPGYQSVETLALSLADVTGVALDARRGWSLDIEEVAAAIRPGTRVVCVSFPNNPTSKLLEPGRFQVLVVLCRHHGIWLVSDEVYRLTERDPARRLPPTPMSAACPSACCPRRMACRACGSAGWPAGTPG